VLSNILIEVGEDSVAMSGTDLDIAVSVTVPAEVEEPGLAHGAGEEAAGAGARAAEHPVRITTKGDRLELTCGRATFRLNGMPRDEFPTFPRSTSRVVEGPGPRAARADPADVVCGVDGGEPADPERRALAAGGRTRCGWWRRTAIAWPGCGCRPEAAGAPRADLIVPPKALAQVERLFSGDDEIEVARSENHIGFRKDGTQVYTRLIEGPYPNYEQVIPKDNDKHAIADRNQLVQALRRMAVVASDQTHRVRLGFTSNTVRFSVETPDLGEAHEDLEVEYAGEPLDIGFNASYLLEVLRYMPTDEVKLTFKAPERAATIEPAGRTARRPTTSAWSCRCACWTDLRGRGSFFERYYAPNNASLVIAGDIDYDEARELVIKWFSEIPAGDPVPALAAPEARLNGNTRVMLEDRVQLPRLYLAWLSPPAYEAGDAEMTALAQVLAGGRNSRLYRRLVYEMEIADDVSAFQRSGKLVSDFVVTATARSGHTLEELETVVLEEIERLRAEPPTTAELDRVRNQYEVGFLEQVERIDRKADQLNEYLFYVGAPGYFAEDLARFRTLTPEALRDAAARHLDPQARVTLSIVPQGASDLAISDSRLVPSENLQNSPAAR
jgi:DNA polymerase III subunit beta